MRATRSLLKLLLLVFAFLSVTTFPGYSQSFELSDGIALFQNGEFEKAISQLEKAVDKDPYNTEGYYYLAASQMGLKKYEAVLSTADKALEVAPENVQMLIVKAEALYHLDYPKAIPVYQKITELAGQRGGDVINKKQAEAYLGYLYKRKANDAFLSGNVDGAVQDYKRARNLTPDSLTVHNNLSYILIQQERWEEAIEALEIGLNRFPTSEQLLFLKGQAHRGAGNSEEMVQSFKVLYELYPDNINYGVIYGQALMATNQARKANEHMNQLIEKHPESEPLYETLKSMSEQRFDMGSKRNVLKLQREAFPDNRLVAMELADTHILLKEYKEAREIYDSLYTASPTPDVALRSARTWIYDGIDEEGLEVYRQLVNEWLNNFKVINETAVVLRSAGLEEPALRLFKNAYAIEKDPGTAIHIIELEDQTKGQIPEHMITDLKRSPYYALGEYFELRHQLSATERTSKKDQFVSSITGILDLYSESTSALTTQTEQVLEGEASPTPEVLQEKRFTEKLSTYVDDWYELLKKSFSSEKQVEIIDEALNEYPGSSRLLYFKGVSKLESGNIAEAKSTFEDAIRNGARDEAIFIKIGDIYAAEEDPDNAILFYERGLSLNNRNKEAYRKIIAVAERYNVLNEVCDRWMLRFETDPDNKTLRDHLISALHKADRFEDARKIIEDN
ncbi:tetratricopeptide repeat protein [Gracilimonas amylolytica]|uniref:tetratricopeptide repeat protein n=1 Tax=Gracilimonas amylolytica TaxID=1749045 RepID=UPI000CD862DB|nr:tetratricopeptide repeat protein [Gracilimonas amylolytica]